MNNTKIKITNYKHKEVHDLLKIPDSVLIHNLQCEIGKLKAYIQKLEEKIQKREDISNEIYQNLSANEKYSIKREICKEQHIKTLKREIVALNKTIYVLRDENILSGKVSELKRKNESLQKDNEKLIIEVVKLRNL